MSVRVLEGHVLDVLQQEPAGAYHVCVTSPPYLWLRSYQTEPQTWPDGWVGELGREPDPETYVAHLVACFRAVRRVLRDDGTLWVNLSGCYYNDPGGQNGGARSMNGEGASTLAAGRTGRTRPPKEAALHAISAKAVEANAQLGRQQRGKHPWLKALDWVDVPGLFARAMQQDGWYWRSDVTWVKPSALPESVSGTRWERCRVKVASKQRGKEAGRLGAVDGMAWIPQSDHGPDGKSLDGQAEWADCPGCPRCAPHGGYVLRRGNGRPSKSTERVLLFGKRPGYFFDAEAVRENLAEATILRDQYTHVGGQRMAALRPGDSQMNTDGVTRTTAGLVRERTSPAAGRNLRDWWVLSPEPLSDQHYAPYPVKLPERCIKAGTSEWGCCPACGAPWARVVEHQRGPVAEVFNPKNVGKLEQGLHSRGTGLAQPGWRQHPVAESTTLGWRPTCRCAEQPPVPARILDCFGGSGATALAANRLGRDATLVELKPAYAALARTRIGREPLSLFASRPEEVPV